jgi:hypothetical protein
MLSNQGTESKWPDISINGPFGRPKPAMIRLAPHLWRVCGAAYEWTSGTSFGIGHGSSQGGPCYTARPCHDIRSGIEPQGSKATSGLPLIRYPLSTPAPGAFMPTSEDFQGRFLMKGSFSLCSCNPLCISIQGASRNATPCRTKPQEKQDSLFLSGPLMATESHG